jgi:N-succinyldiaminopimelate aminotransferase
MSHAHRSRLTSRLRGFGTTVFTEMSQLAAAHDAINLGQGFPDFDGPDFVKRAAIRAIEEGHNQYARSHGLPVLNEAIAHHQARFRGLEYDPEDEITVCGGATEALFATFQALLDAGDEVIVFEPYYDSYPACIAAAGGVMRVVTLRAPDFRFDAAELEAAVTPRTRAVVVNTPHNPTGKVYDRAELDRIAAVCCRHDLLCITDEVYEHLVFEGEHVAIAGLPGMRERTIRISSAGKTFSFTGWKIGFAATTRDLTRAIRTAHQFITFCNATPFQVALAEAFRAPDEYFETLLAEYRERRDLLCRGLAQVGFGVLEPAGTYFVLTDIRPLGFDDDVAFCRMLPERVGVAAIPPTAFYENEDEGRHLVRWAFCKRPEAIAAALERLAGLRP